MASVRQAKDHRTGEARDGVWEVRVYAGRADGKDRWLSRTYKGTRREAEKFAARLELEQGAGATTADPTLDELLTRWLRHLEARKRSPNTLAGYRSKLRYLPKAMLGKRLSRLTAGDLDALYDVLTDRDLAPATVRQVHAIVRAALHQAERWGLVTRNVAALASPPSVGQREQHPPTAGEVRRILEHARADRRQPDFAVWLHLAAATGARRAEVCGLQWADLDPVAGTLAVRRSVAYPANELAVLPTKTRSTRVVRLDPHTLGLLAEHRDRQEQRARRAQAALPAWIFCDEGDVEPWRPDRVTRAWTRLRDAHGFGAVRVHDIRHFAATELLAAGVPLPTVASRLGHADGITTMRTYAHQTRPADQLAADVLGAALTP